MKIACIGAGDIVRATHLPVLKAMQEVEVIWVTDTDENRARDIARVHNVPFYPLPNDLSHLAEADVYLLACPFGVRDPYFSVLRERSVSLYVEKPFARSSKRHSELCSWFPDFALASGLMMRCWGPNMMVRDILRQKVFGRLKSIRFEFGKPGVVTQGSYYFEPSRGGAGMISEMGIHGVDAALFVTRAVNATFISAHVVNEGDLDLHTDASFEVRSQDDEEFHFKFTISSLQPTIEGIEIECEYATLTYSLPGQGYALMGEQVKTHVTIIPASGGPTYVIKPYYGADQSTTKFQMFHKNWTMFLEGINKYSPNWTAASQSQLTTEVIEKCYQATTSQASAG